MIVVAWRCVFLETSQVYRLLRVRDFEKQVLAEFQVPEKPHPTILMVAIILFTSRVEFTKSSKEHYAIEGMGGRVEL